MRFSLWLLIVVLTAGGASAQVIQSVRFVINVSAVPLTINAGEVELDGLQAGTTYSAVPDGVGSLLITPNDGLASVLSATETSITGDINGKIMVSFILPTHLYPTSGSFGGFVSARFTNNSAAWGATGAETNYFDPNTPVQINLDASGRAYVTLGGIFEVPGNAGAETYVGDALLTAQYTGL